FARVLGRKADDRACRQFADVELFGDKIQQRTHKPICGTDVDRATAYRIAQHHAGVSFYCIGGPFTYDNLKQLCSRLSATVGDRNPPSRKLSRELGSEAQTG